MERSGMVSMTVAGTTWNNWRRTRSFKAKRREVRHETSIIPALCCVLSGAASSHLGRCGCAHGTGWPFGWGAQCRGVGRCARGEFHQQRIPRRTASGGCCYDPVCCRVCRGVGKALHLEACPSLLRDGRPCVEEHGGEAMVVRAVCPAAALLLVGCLATRSGRAIAGDGTSRSVVYAAGAANGFSCIHRPGAGGVSLPSARSRPGALC